jgi:hypothetical protein
MYQVGPEKANIGSEKRKDKEDGGIEFGNKSFLLI